MSQKRGRNSLKTAMDEEEVPAWLMTYADMMTLLLVFFILLFSLSTFNKKKYDSALSSIQIALNSAGVSKISQEDMKHSLRGKQIVPEENQEEGLDEDTLQATEQRTKVIADMVKASNLSSDVAVSSKDGKIFIRVKGNSMFPSGSDELSWESEQIFDVLLRVFQRYPQYKINIGGHTDNMPIRTKKFPTNWELSALRATATLRYLLDADLSPQRMTATGYAASMPLTSNNTAENREKNRRVEFVLEEPKK